MSRTSEPDLSLLRGQGVLTTRLGAGMHHCGHPTRSFAAYKTLPRARHLIRDRGISSSSTGRTRVIFTARQDRQDSKETADLFTVRTRIESGASTARPDSGQNEARSSGEMLTSRRLFRGPHAKQC